MKHVIRTAGVGSILAVCLAASALAQPQGPGGERGERRAPPQEFVDACTGKAEGDAVKLTLKGREGESREVDAKCQLRDGVLSARPERPEGSAPARHPQS